MTEPTTAGGAVLPVVGYRLNSGHGNHLRETLDDATKAFLWAGKPAWRELTYRDTAQAEIDALRTEIERWKSTLWAVARELNCLPSTFSDGNAHVLKAAISLRAELAALKAAQDDQARDARRYRWLRANREEQTADGTAVDVYDEDGTLLWYDYLDAAIDSAIDSAIAATKETP